MNTTKHGVSLTMSLVLTLIGYAYMVFLKVPSVLEVRPELADVGFWTGVFSGRGTVYLWYHHETAMVALSFLITLLALEVVLTMGEN